MAQNQFEYIIIGAGRNGSGQRRYARQTKSFDNPGAVPSSAVRW
ncbi:MAG: hypothetical protein U0V48_04780 [Anaerolineales bacterium]